MAALVGCGGGSDGGGMTGPKGNVVLRDVNNYTSQSSLTIPKVETAPGVDLDICWGGITKDIQCHDLAPTADIDSVSFLQILRLSEAEIEAKMAAGQLAAADVKFYRNYDAEAGGAATCTKLSTLKLGMTTVDPAQDFVEGADKRYMVLFSNGHNLGSGARTMLFVEPTASSTVTSIMAPDGCGLLDFSADITTPPPLDIPIAGPWKVDWSQITHDSIGNAVVFQNIDTLLVGFYEGMTVAELQARFLDIEILATSLYRAAVPAGMKYGDLANTMDAGGQAFPGFGRTNGVWAVGLLCSACQNPAPVALAILAPTP